MSLIPKDLFHVAFPYKQAFPYEAPDSDLGLIKHFYQAVALFDLFKVIFSLNGNLDSW